MANIMAACLLGCDELFEHGYIDVTRDGTLAIAPAPTPLVGLLTRVDRLPAAEPA
ncbi:hypothetical protein [Streptomyces sp. NPDC059378]|uniref:hypothetical protein n=1 Tax=Streptomyces sp. NPDC059378 TaxID=3346815 RepID=UPI0036BDD428